MDFDKFEDKIVAIVSKIISDPMEREEVIAKIMQAAQDSCEYCED